MKNIQILDTVAIINPVSLERLTLVDPEHSAMEGLPSGQVGTIVEVYEQEGKHQYLVEFSEHQGREYAMAILQEDELLVLHYELQVA